MQLAQDEGSPVRGFGVVEYESAEQAEAVLIEMDRTLLGGQEVRLSLCTPGTSGRSTLAALIAAQGMVSTINATQPITLRAHVQHVSVKAYHKKLQIIQTALIIEDKSYTVMNLQDHYKLLNAD